MMFWGAGGGAAVIMFNKNCARGSGFAGARFPVSCHYIYTLQLRGQRPRYNADRGRKENGKKQCYNEVRVISYSEVNYFFLIFVTN